MEAAGRREESFIDEHGVRVHWYGWAPEKPRGVLQLAHGLGEYALRWERFALDLVEAGWAVYADDHRGHGRTGLEQHGGDYAKLGRLGPGGLRATMEDIRQLTSIARAEHPSLPLVLMGHSWGSLMVQSIVDRHSRDYDGVVLSGTAYRTLTRMNSGQLNRRHRHLGTTGNEWLSRDPAVAAAFVDDPFTFYADARKLFGLVDGMRLLGRPARGLADVPLLILIGEEDSLGGPRSVELLARAYTRRSGLADVRVKVYDEARHEIFNETNRDEVVADLVAWLEERVRD